MRAVVAGSGADVWCSPVQRRPDQFVVSEFLTKSAIVSMSSEEWSEVRQRLAREVQQSPQSRFTCDLLDLLRTVPMSDRIGKPPVDIYLSDYLADEDLQPLVAAGIDGVVKDLVESRRQALERLRSRNAVYNAMVRPFASTAERVRLLDPWAASEISQEREGISWLVEHLVQDGIREIEILSLRYERAQIGVDERAFERLWRDHARPDIRLRLIVAEPLGDAHDRQMRFFYPDGARTTPVVALGRGVSVFEKEQFTTPPTITDASEAPGAAEKREDVIYRSRNQRRTFELPEPPARPQLRGPEASMRRQPS